MKTNITVNFHWLWFLSIMIIISLLTSDCTSPSSVIDNGIIIEVENRRNSGKSIKIFDDLQMITLLEQGQIDKILVEDGSALLAKIYDASILTEKKITARKNLIWSLP